MAEHLPPPIYSQQDPVDSISSHTYQALSEPQILILPTVDAVNFQKGYLGAEGEQAAVEGELQIKGVDAARWDRITISLRSFENAYQHEIGLASYERELYARTDAHDIFPSSIPFAIPIASDTPQSIQTPHSTLGHQLTATLYPADNHLSSLSKSLTVHTRRYTSHYHTLPPSPETYSLNEPTRVEVQVPRNTFTSGEVIPLYVTVPPPTRETVVRRGLRLRNVRAELVRVVKVKREHSEDAETDSDSDIADENSNIQGGSSLGASQQPHASSKMPLSPLFLGSSYRVIIARSGASCRFHSSRPIQLRFILHQNSTGSPSDSRTSLGRVDSDAESPLITQSTLLHSVTFHIKVHISFVDTSNQTECISTVVVPISILPPLAPLPEVSQAVDDAYQKKHDRPPAKTTRQEEVDPSIPYYSEGEAGPSMLSSGAPPPFEERDAPPPFFVSALETSSSRLPTFQESETEIILPETGDLMNEIPLSYSISGEGTLFGFLSSHQFDGHSEDMEQSSTPPPTLEMASGDTDLTALADQPNRVSMEALSLALEQHDENPRVEEQPPPPPPPAMDDPSDPPPSIDSDFRSPVVAQQTSPSRASPPLHVVYHQSDAATGLHMSPPVLAPEETRLSHGHAPPPYLTDNHRENESDQVIRPPPYVD